MNETILPTSATLTRCVAGYIAVTLLLTATTFACHFRASMVAGLHRTVHAAGNISGRPLLHDVARSLTLDFLNAETDVPERLNVVWKGFWFLPETQAVRLSLGDGYSVTVWINGRRVLYRQPGEPARSGGRHVVTLPAGLHPLLVSTRGARAIIMPWACLRTTWRRTVSFVPVPLRPTCGSLGRPSRLAPSPRCCG